MVHSDAHYYNVLSNVTEIVGNMVQFYNSMVHIKSLIFEIFIMEKTSKIDSNYLGPKFNISTYNFFWDNSNTRMVSFSPPHMMSI